MANVGEIDGMRVMIFSNDHSPAHVHVFGAECTAIFYLNCPEGPPELRENYGFTTRKLSKIKAGLMSRLAHFCVEWSRIYG